MGVCFGLIRMALGMWFIRSKAIFIQCASVPMAADWPFVTGRALSN